MENTIICGDSLGVLKTLDDESVQCCITSPPYFGLRDYGMPGQIGLEETPEEFVESLVKLFREVRRVLKKDGTLWLNLGDSYAGSGKGIGSDHGKAVFSDDEIPKTDWKSSGLKAKDLIGIPWRVAFALQADGWWLRQDIIWSKKNCMPESVTDRCTKNHEYIFLLAKSSKYYFDSESIKEKSERDWSTAGGNLIGKGVHKQGGKYKDLGQGRNYGGAGSSFQGHSGNYKADGTLIGGEFRNKRSVWEVSTKPFKEAHFATFPEDLISPMVLAGCPEGGLILDPFMGAGTTALVCKKLRRNWLGVELNPEYIKIAEKRLDSIPYPMF